jgi:hypothetical protein
MSRRIATKAALTAIAIGAVLTGPLATASADTISFGSQGPDYTVIDPSGNGYVPPSSAIVGGTPSYDGVPRLLQVLSAQTGKSCWTASPYLANDGRWYDVACF